MWLLEQSARESLEQAQKLGLTPSIDQQTAFEAARFSAAESGGSRVLMVNGDNAEIAIEGVITKTPNLLARLFGGGNTTYAEIVSAISDAENNESVKNITLAIDSPGGQFDGLFDALAAIQAAKKPVIAKVSSLAASAAYAIASQADQIIAGNRAARFGSVGVVATFFDDPSEISITSTNAPKKRPDITTDDGKAVVREELDAMHQIFVEAIADGRGMTVDMVNDDFGRGATVLAEQALKRGMIDSIASPALKVVNSQLATVRKGGNQLEIVKMDLETLKNQHAELYAAAVQKGVEKERDRVTAHLIMGEKSGAMETASQAIKDGSEMTATLQATYLTAGMNRSDIATRQREDLSAAKADSASSQDENDSVVNMLEARVGIRGEK